MPKKTKVEQELDLAKVVVGKSEFTLLNQVKAKKALDYMEEKDMKATPENLLAMYDRLGGAVRLSTELGQRALALGAFFDFENKVAKKGLDYNNLEEENFTDEIQVVKKAIRKAPKKTSVADRLAKLEEPSKKGKTKEEAAEPEE